MHFNKTKILQDKCLSVISHQHGALIAPIRASKISRANREINRLLLWLQFFLYVHRNLPRGKLKLLLVVQNFWGGGQIAFFVDFSYKFKGNLSLKGAFLRGEHAPANTGWYHLDAHCLFLNSCIFFSGDCFAKLLFTSWNDGCDETTLGWNEEVWGWRLDKWVLEALFSIDNRRGDALGASVSNCFGGVKILGSGCSRGVKCLGSW